MPSWVSFVGTKKLVGKSAKDQVASNPTNTVYDVKRILGRSFHDPVVQSERKHLSYTIVEGRNGEPKIQLNHGNREFAPEEISAMILSTFVFKNELMIPVCVEKSHSFCNLTHYTFRFSSFF